MAPVLEITGLSTHIRQPATVIQAVGDVDLYLAAGETLGLVGESGCGKSMTGLSVMGLLPPGGYLVGGSIKLEGRELVGSSEQELRKIRGNDIAMIFQDPLTSLNPTRTIGSQVAEPVMLHRGASKKTALRRATDVLDMVGLPRPAERLNDYPHQLSGGMRQRVMIAMALSCEPKVLIADEPTTALDVTIQAQILDLLDRLKSQLGMAMLLITHDMGVIAGHTDRVNVMYAGRIVETADTGDLFSKMRHPYTQALLASIPRLAQDRSLPLLNIGGIPPDLGHLPAGCRFAARCPRADDICRVSEPSLTGATDHLFACWHPVEGPLDPAKADAIAKLPAGPALVREPAPVVDGSVVDASVVDGSVTDGSVTDGALPAGPLLQLHDLVKEFPATGGILPRRAGAVQAVSGVSFGVGAGETFGLVGESGCGKTTIGRMIVALEQPTGGSVTLNGVNIAALRGHALRTRRSDLQLIFQDSSSSLDPRMRVGSIIREPLTVKGIGSRAEQQQRVLELLDEVGLPRNVVERFPHEFSGGQRQRIGLARALTLSPKVIVADEPVSALDVSIRAQVLNLMRRLQAARGLTYVLISHDLAVVRYLADRIGVMYLGKLVEVGTSDDIYLRHAHPYTAGLISAIPVPDPAVAPQRRGEGITGELPSPRNPPSGCRFRTRCPFAQEICAMEEPMPTSFGAGHLAACHFPLQQAEKAGG